MVLSTDAIYIKQSILEENLQNNMITSTAFSNLDLRNKVIDFFENQYFDVDELEGVIHVFLTENDDPSLNKIKNKVKNISKELLFVIKKSGLKTELNDFNIE